MSLMGDRQVKPFGEPGYFFECPRWREGRWWVSDMRAQCVFSYDAEGTARTELHLEDDRPAGLGWAPDGSLLVVSMEKRQLLRRAPNAAQAEVFADLGSLGDDTPGFLNDMGVSDDGHAYIGFDPNPHTFGMGSDLGKIVHVDPQGRGEIAAQGLYFPNGIVIAPDGSSVIVAETGRPQFSGFAIGANGALGPAVIWADLASKTDRRPAGQPPLGEQVIDLDGCAMDPEGHIWAADIRSGCLRVAEGGDIIDSIFLPAGLHPFACGVGGDGGDTLMICGADLNYAERMARKGSRLFTVSL
jgi:sugar lactone lactonase YvrE